MKKFFVCAAFSLAATWSATELLLIRLRKALHQEGSPGAGPIHLRRS